MSVSWSRIAIMCVLTPSGVTDASILVQMATVFLTNSTDAGVRFLFFCFQEIFLFSSLFHLFQVISISLDVDECSSGATNCSQSCFNTPGSFYCMCYNDSYILDVDNTTCIGKTKQKVRSMWIYILKYSGWFILTQMHYIFTLQTVNLSRPLMSRLMILQDPS